MAQQPVWRRTRRRAHTGGRQRRRRSSGARTQAGGRKKISFGSWGLVTQVGERPTRREDRAIKTTLASTSNRGRAVQDYGVSWVPGVEPEHCLNASSGASTIVKRKRTKLRLVGAGRNWKTFREIKRHNVNKISSFSTCSVQFFLWLVVSAGQQEIWRPLTAAQARR